MDPRAISIHVLVELAKRLPDPATYHKDEHVKFLAKSKLHITYRRVKTFEGWKWHTRIPEDVSYPIERG